MEINKSVLRDMGNSKPTRNQYPLHYEDELRHLKLSLKHRYSDQLRRQVMVTMDQYRFLPLQMGYDE